MDKELLVSRTGKTYQLLSGRVRLSCIHPLLRDTWSYESQNWALRYLLPISADDDWYEAFYQSCIQSDRFCGLLDNAQWAPLLHTDRH